MDTPIIPQKRTIKRPQDYLAAAAAHGYTWLGPFPKNSQIPTRWRCPLGHEWETSLHGLAGCNTCSYKNRHDSLRLKPDDYSRLANDFGVAWLGPEVRNILEHTRWKCPCGCEWESPYGKFLGCPDCRRPHRADARRKQPDDYVGLAESRGFIWLGPEVASNSKRTKWQCAKGHIWETSYGCIRAGCGCRRCAYDARQELHRRKPDDYVALASLRGFIWLGPEVKTTKHSTQWKCRNGHAWSASFNNIEKGNGCPSCLGYINGVRVSKPQIELSVMIGGILNFKVGRYSIDVALLDSMIAIEYDNQYWHSLVKNLDDKKTRRLIELGWRVLRVKARYLLPSPEQLDIALSSLRNGDTYQEIILSDWVGNADD